MGGGGSGGDGGGDGGGDSARAEGGEGGQGVEVRQKGRREAGAERGIMRTDRAEYHTSRIFHISHNISFRLSDFRGLRFHPGRDRLTVDFSSAMCSLPGSCAWEPRPK